MSCSNPVRGHSWARHHRLTAWRDTQAAKGLCRLLCTRNQRSQHHTRCSPQAQHSRRYHILYKGATTIIQPRSTEAKIDEMLEAGIMCPIHPWDVRFVAQTVLAQKAHDGQGLPLDELKHRINEQCIKYGLPGEFDMPPWPKPSEIAIDKSRSDRKQPTKWRLCQDFNGINRVTECYDFSYFALFTHVFSLFLEVSHGTAALTHFSLTHITATLLTHSTAVVLTHSIAILIALPHCCSIYSGQSCRLFFS